MRRTRLILLLAILSVGTSFAARAAELDLFDWMGPSPIVVAGDVLKHDGKYVEVRVDRVIRGELPSDDVIHVNLRRANRNRPYGSRALKLPEGQSFLLLLKLEASRKETEIQGYDLVRGVHGAREVPAEAGRPVLDAAETLARIQDQRNEKNMWIRMRDLLEDTNPILIRTALEHHFKFGRGTPELLLVIRPLLGHPRADLREAAARLIGQILSRYGNQAVPEEALLRAELAGRARRDAVIAVRVAATKALTGLWNEGTEEVLEQIADRDPDQLVRYTAQKLLYERRTRQEGGRDGS